MKILLLTPAPATSLSGNRATAERWAHLLTRAGHQVRVNDENDAAQAGEAELLIALHAWRTREVVADWRAQFPDRPVIVALTGTDVYRFAETHQEETLAAMAAADGLIGLHSLVADDIPESCHQKLSIVLQSAEAPDAKVQPTSRAPRGFEVCIIGHLRDEKDPLRAARASRLLPATSGIHVVQAGKAHDEEWERAAEAEMEHNPRYRWLGEISHESTRRLMASSRLMVISSLMEGGANVISEACRAGLPVLASDIPGNRGLLGEHYPGRFPARDEQALADLLERAENDGQWLLSLKAITEDLARQFTPEAEQASLEQAIEKTLRLSRGK